MRSKNRLNRAMSMIALAVLVLIILLIVVSWIVAALTSGTAIRSPLSSEGARWLLGSFASNMASTGLVWILMTAMAYGAIKYSRIWHDWMGAWGGKTLTYRQKYAFRIVYGEIGIFVILGLLLTLLPHAPLLSVTGHLFPSSFSSSIIPSITIMAMVIAATYGKLCTHFSSLTSVFSAISTGVAEAAPIIIIFLMISELWYIVGYVFGLY